MIYCISFFILIFKELVFEPYSLYPFWVEDYELSNEDVTASSADESMNRVGLRLIQVNAP